MILIALQTGKIQKEQTITYPILREHERSTKKSHTEMQQTLSTNSTYSYSLLLAMSTNNNL